MKELYQATQLAYKSTVVSVYRKEFKKNCARYSLPIQRHPMLIELTFHNHTCFVSVIN